MGSRLSPPPAAVIDVAALVPSQRDFLQAVRTARRALALIPCISVDNPGRDAQRMADAGVSALAMTRPCSAMAEASNAAPLPMLSLRLLTSQDCALEARAFGADAVIVDPAVPDGARREIADSARSMRMVVLPLTATPEQTQGEAQRGARALVVGGKSVASIAVQTAGAHRAIVIAWLMPETSGLTASPRERDPEDDVRALFGLVDAAIVDMELSSAAGFERLVSELNP